MWKSRETWEAVLNEDDYATPEDTYHRLRRKRIGRARKFFNLEHIPVLTKLREQISLVRIRYEFYRMLVSGKLYRLHDEIFFPR